MPVTAVYAGKREKQEKKEKRKLFGKSIKEQKTGAV